MAIITSHAGLHLDTVLKGPLHPVEKLLLAQHQAIETWFEEQWRLTPASVYGSVDLRNAGFKIAPVDMNLFPAGFNNIRANSMFTKASEQAALKSVLQWAPNAKHILLLPENHTRNQFYWESLKAIFDVLTGAGFVVRVGSLLDNSENTEIVVTDGGLLLEPVIRSGNQLKLKDFTPDFIILNNDCADGVPTILNNLQQPIMPPPSLGWDSRLKSSHFAYYAKVTDEFAKSLNIDAWLLSPLFSSCDNINFMDKSGQAELAEQVDQLLAAIKAKYTQHHIANEPYAVIKANSGTYGMAVMMVKSAEEVLNLNRKQRSHMAKSKGGASVSSVIIQEGVHTLERWGDNNAVAEPVVYMWGEQTVGGFYRIHNDKQDTENLNTPGMHFSPMAVAQDPQTDNRFYAYNVVARLSMLAAAREIKALRDPK